MPCFREVFSRALTQVELVVQHEKRTQSLTYGAHSGL